MISENLWSADGMLELNLVPVPGGDWAAGSICQVVCDVPRGSSKSGESTTSHLTCNTALQSQKAVAAHLKSEQLLPFGFARQNRDHHTAGTPQRDVINIFTVSRNNIEMPPHFLELK